MSNSRELITDYRDYRARLTKFGEHRVCEVFAGGLLMKIHSAPDGSRIVREGTSCRHTRFIQTGSLFLLPISCTRTPRIPS
jgi:hypothetical protein